MTPDCEALRRTVEEHHTLLRGMSREDMVTLKGVAASTRGRQTLAKMVRGFVGWVTLLATAVGALLAVGTKLFDGG